MSTGDRRTTVLKKSMPKPIATAISGVHGLGLRLMLFCSSLLQNPVIIASSMLAEEDVYYLTQHGQCIKCAPGQYFLKDCLPGDTNSTQCAPCPTGRYMPIWNKKHACRSCRKCGGLDEIFRTQCSPTHDAVCGCRDGYWHYKPNTPMSKCFPYTVCGKGYGVIVEGTDYKDLKCAKCRPGQTFSDIESTLEKCRNCTNCSSLGLNETISCKIQADAVCDYKTTQPPSTISDGSDTKPGANETTSSSPLSEQDVDITTIVMIVVCVILFIISVVVACYYRQKVKAGCEWFRKCYNDFQLASDRRSVKYVHTTTGGSVSVNLATSLPGSQCRSRKISHPFITNSSPKTLRPGVTLDEAFNHVIYNHGAGYRSTGLALPGRFKLTEAEIDNIEELRRGIPDKMSDILYKWKEKNPEEGTLDNLYRTLLPRKPDLANDIDRLYAQPQAPVSRV